MKFSKKLFSTLLLLFITMSGVAYFFWYQPKFSNKSNIKSFSSVVIKGNSFTLFRIRQLASEIKKFALTNGYGSDYCFMADMKIASGEKRFFVYDLINDSIRSAGLVAHGSGGSLFSRQIKFSNKPNSFCTSLGKYKIGKSYIGKFGLAFKLHGLDSTNSNAFNRFVVLHAHSCVPNEETAPLPICESQGCPTVAPLFLNELKSYINQSENPILLLIYY